MTRLWIGRSEDDPDVVATWGLFELDAEGLEELRDDPAWMTSETRRLERMAPFQEELLALELLPRRRGGGAAGGADLERVSSATMRRCPTTSGGIPIIARMRPTKKSATSCRARMPFGPVPVPDAVVETEDRAREQPRVVLRDRALAASRWRGNAPRRTRGRVCAPARPAAPALRAVRCPRAQSRACSATSTRLRRISRSVSSKQSSQHGDRAPRAGSACAAVIGETQVEVLDGASRITYRQCCLESK